MDFSTGMSNRIRFSKKNYDRKVETVILCRASIRCVLLHWLSDSSYRMNVFKRYNFLKLFFRLKKKTFVVDVNIVFLREASSKSGHWLMLASLK